MFDLEFFGEEKIEGDAVLGGELDDEEEGEDAGGDGDVLGDVFLVVVGDPLLVGGEVHVGMGDSEQGDFWA